MGVFYVDNSIIGAQELEWLQNGLNFFIGLFRKYGIIANVAKSRPMTCQPGALWLDMSEEVVS